ncbi:hypothetical protein [Nocardioides bizhenqiangii]|uniref:Uncharacterized protein n=1 Tax=Nocardioides bizhenqiangii TaxID=3095076 RepID=A0ABZ0ZTN8_9ACTN|nr:hypothetical protein [Nocardioides sp. HM61]WQQ27640.1 hypothetical protein SHK19_05240 [Nocardioides sp. HM61]
MKHVGRTLSAVATTIGLALVATGCASNVIGDDGPRPGIAAAVEDTEITLDELTAVVDGLCTLQETNPDPAAVGTSREYAQSQILQQWIAALVDAEFADDQQIEATAEDPGLELAPGWDDVDEDDREALQDYADTVLYSSAVRQEVEEGEAPDPADYDIAINPRFDVRLEGAEFVPAGEQLSVPVSDEAATEIEAPTPEALRELPEDELCGKRPDPAAAPPVPLG